MTTLTRVQCDGVGAPAGERTGTAVNGVLAATGRVVAEEWSMAGPTVTVADVGVRGNRGAARACAARVNPAYGIGVVA